MNLIHRYMLYDNFCSRCVEPDETVNYAIFKCPPALQTWSLSSTPLCPDLLLISRIYVNMDYIFWRKSVEDPQLEMDLYPYIIWYVWKSQNDKLLRGIDRDPFELIRYTKGKCHAWSSANVFVPKSPQQSVTESQAISLDNICMVAGS